MAPIDSALNEIKQKNESQGSFVKMIKQILLFVWVQVRTIVDYFIDVAFGFYYDKKARRVPPVKNELLLKSATELAAKIREKKVSSEEVVRSFVERCKEVNNLLNAIVDERYNDAIQEARTVDEMLKTVTDTESLKETKPFLGVPFVTKESNEAKGLLHSMGLVARKNHRSEEDATAIGYMKQAGGILLGKTNIPELNGWIESRNNVYGQTNNPYNTTRTVGGSSGGDAAVVTACGAPFAVGSDIGGSIRIPAFCNGVYGHKPSEALTSLKGIGLRKKDPLSSMAEVGPICKSAVDLEPIFRVLIGENVSKVKLDTPVDLKKLNLFYQEESGDLRCSKLSKSMKLTLARAVKHMENITGSSTKIHLPGSEYSFNLWRYWMTQEEASVKYDLTNQTGETTAIAEIWKLLRGKSQVTMASILQLIQTDIFPKVNAAWAESVTRNMKKNLIEKLGDNGVLLYTSAPTTSMYHYASYLRPYNFSYFALFNVLKVPVCQIPMGLDENGLPVGIQVIAAPYNDHLCFAVAREFEKNFAWTAPS